MVKPCDIPCLVSLSTSLTYLFSHINFSALSLSLSICLSMFFSFSRSLFAHFRIHCVLFPQISVNFPYFPPTVCCFLLLQKQFVSITIIPSQLPTLLSFIRGQNYVSTCPFIIFPFSHSRLPARPTPTPNQLYFVQLMLC